MPSPVDGTPPSAVGPVSEPVPVFPFSAVVGHDEPKLALMLAAAEPALGGVLLRGQKGSAKTTLARALARLVPGGGPFIELPLGATEDRVVGALDLEEALTGGRRRFRPGLLAAAHGGVLYVDEINLLADHLVDVLLDVAVSGVNRVERDGLSETHPARFVLVGSMNPEEGELRPQLLDRFGLAVEIRSDDDPEERAEAVRRRLAFDADPAVFVAAWVDAEAELAGRLGSHSPASLPAGLVTRVSALCAEAGAEGLRADLVICRAAAALAGFEGRSETSVEDVRRVAALALGHRRRRGPFDHPGISQEEIDQALGDAPASGGGNRERSADGAAQDSGSTAGGAEPDGPGDVGGDGGGSDRSPEGSSAGSPDGSADQAPVVPGRPATGQLGEEPRGATRRDDPASMLRGRGPVATASRGRQISDRPVDGALGSLAVTATAQRAAVRRATDPSTAASVLVARDDLREAVLEERTSRLVILAVDASGSMGVRERMEAVKGAVLGLLLDAYQQRDRVALVTFRGESADVSLRPTGSVEVARARLAELPTGGRTPLAAGLRAAAELARTAQGRRPVVVVVSDGRATWEDGGADPLRAALDAAAAMCRQGVESVVIDAESGTTRLGLAAQLAEAMGARLVSLPEWSPAPVEALLRTL